MSQTPDSSVDWNLLRQRFPVFENKTYINSCSYGAISTDAMDALQQYMTDRLHKGSDWEDWVGRNERVRQALATLLGASDDEVAVTASASAGINSIASALNFDGPRKKVVTSNFAFPTNAQIWYAQELRGATVHQIHDNDGVVTPEQFEEAIDEDTLLVAVTLVCFRNGVKLDIPAIAEIAKRKGAMLLVDGYQALGTMEFDVGKIQPDFVVGGMVKYLLGSAGLGFAYVRKGLIESLTPTVTGWFAQADIMAMDNTRYDPSPTARRFEAGTPPVPNCYTAEAGLGIINEVGLAAIEGRVAELTADIVSRSNDAGYVLGMPDDPARRGPMVSIQSTDEHALVSALENDGIVTSCRGGNLRISPHFYNNAQDFDSLFAALRTHENLLVRA